MTDILIYVEAACIIIDRFPFCFMQHFVSQRHFGSNSAILRIRFIPM